MLDLRAFPCLPIRACLLDAGGREVARTPEWMGPGMGGTTFVLDSMRVLVAPTPSGNRDLDSAAARLTDDLVDELHRAAAGLDGEGGRRLRVLADVLGVVSGQRPRTTGTMSDAIAYLQAALPSRTDVHLMVGDVADSVVMAPAAIAGALLQIVVNAGVHDNAAAVRLDVLPGGTGPVVLVQWPGPPPAPDGQLLRTSRAQRRTAGAGTGLAVARVVADAVGARMLGVVPGVDPESGEPRPDWTRVELALGVTGLALPLACVRNQRVEWCTGNWMEERYPGVRSAAGERLGALSAAALGSPGTIVTDGELAARSAPVDMRVWMAQPPDSGHDRALLALRFIEHERALDALGPSTGERIRGLADVLSGILGRPLDAVSADGWNRDASLAWASIGAVAPAPAFCGERIVMPRVAAFLLAALDGTIEEAPDAPILRVGRERVRDPLALLLCRGGTDIIDLCGLADDHGIPCGPEAGR